MWREEDLKVKRTLSSLDVAVLTKELQNIVTGAWIDNIYSSRDSLLTKLRVPSSEASFLLIQPGVRMNITKYPVKTELSGRAKIFRRFIRNSKILSISQVEFERIVEAQVMKGGTKMRVVIELMPRGVVSVVGENGSVLISNRDLNLRDRKIYPGATYKYPPLFPDPRKMRLEKCLEVLKSGRTVGSALIKDLGLPPEVINEVLPEDIRLSQPSELNINDLKSAIQAVKAFIKEVMINPQPTVTECEGEMISFQPFLPKHLPAPTCKVIRFTTLNEAVDEYFRNLMSFEENTVGGEERGRTQAALYRAEESLMKLENELRALQIRLKLFEENYLLLERAWKCVREAVKKRGWEEGKKCEGVVGVDPHQGIFKVCVGKEIMEISIRDDLQAQYLELRRRFGILRRKISRAEESVKTLREKAVEERAVRLHAEKIKVVKKVEWFHVYHWLITRNGYLAIGGRDAQQNEKVVKKYLRDNDIFVHSVIHGASAFVLRSGGQAPIEDIKDVAVMAVSYSKGWASGTASLDAFWVWGKQVSKSPPPGEFLPKGSFMIYGRKNILKGLELRLAVGVRVLEGRYFEVVAGPEELLRLDADTVAYAVIVPGDLKPHEVAKQILKSLSEAPYLFKGLTETDIALRIPGKSRIVNLVVRP